ncbi:neurexin-3-like [Montipora capricornis]|uniref:neurexin-3-like n=1 Tax=Montipora capricornis TaxID=246305 RepID=UPI0035F1091A
MKVWRFEQICFVIVICHHIICDSGLKTDENINTLKYSKFAYSAFSSLQFTNNSTLVFRFKTRKKDGMLFYMDDQGIKEYMDAFLLNGNLRLRLTIGRCRQRQHFINGTFNDLNWHKITLKRTSKAVLAGVDYNTSYTLCDGLRKTDFRKRSPLYVSYFPSKEWGHPKWSLGRDSWIISMQYGGFEGCIKTPKYAVGNENFRRARLLETKRTVRGCRNACKDSSFSRKCLNGGKCVNGIVRRECDCRRTGFFGSNCSQAIVQDSIKGLRFSGRFSSDSLQGSYAEFNGWPMAENSELQFYFKTASTKPALLVYQDAMEQQNYDRDSKDDFIEVSLLSNGNIELQLSANKCSYEQVILKNNFTDGLWHKFAISRHRSELVLSVDNVSAPLISCEEVPRLAGLRGKAKRPLFIGGIPFLDSKGDTTHRKWSKIGLLSKIVDDNRWFHGCVALVRYSSARGRLLANANLVKSHGVQGNCSGEACSGNLFKCQNGGRCVDLVINTECNCYRTGYYGQYCEQSGSSPTAANESSSLATRTPNFQRDSESENNNNNNNNLNNNEEDVNSDSSTAREKKDPRNSSVSFLALGPKWCLLILMANFVSTSCVLN